MGASSCCLENMLINEIVLATHNAKKLVELQVLLGDSGIASLSLAELPDTIEVVEDGDSFREYAEKKAVQQAVHLDRWCIGEDSGLCVDALKGAPGIFSARFSGENATDDLNNQKLVEALEKQKRRSAHYVCHAAISNPQGEVVFNAEGKCFGEIRLTPSGEGGFGYDPYFEVREYGLTMAELGNHVKSVISHRAKAMREVTRFLTTVHQ